MTAVSILQSYFQEIPKKLTDHNEILLFIWNNYNQNDKIIVLPMIWRNCILIRDC